MISKEITQLLDNQIKMESTASMEYMAMATWAEYEGFNGVAKFFYGHAEEERMHMIKLVKFVNSRGGRAVIPDVGGFMSKFKDLNELFSHFLSKEETVTAHVNEVVSACLSEKDYITHNFMLWYVAEQMEEEELARNVIDKLNIIGDDKSGHYLFDQELGNFRDAHKIS